MSRYSEAGDEHQFILKKLKSFLSQLIEENEFQYCYRIELHQHDLIVKDYVSEILEGIDLE